MSVVDEKEDVPEIDHSQQAATGGRAKPKQLATEDLIELASKNAPQFLTPYIKKYGLPVLTYGSKVIDTCGPTVRLMIKKSKKAYKFAKENNIVDDYGPIFLGLVYIFFGGYFTMTIAAIEAVRHTAWENFKEAFTILHRDYKIVAAANKADNAEDDDNDGVADVLQIDEKELLTRKVKLFMVSVNAHELSKGFTALYTGFVAVLAALKLQFARTIALGVTIGETLYNPVKRYVRPLIIDSVEEKYHKWVDIIMLYICKSLGVSVAMFVQRVLSSFHSSLRGGAFLLMGVLAYAKRNKQIIPEATVELAVGAVCVLGFIFQLGNLYVLPWWLKLPLFPFVLMEYFITWMVAVQE